LADKPDCRGDPTSSRFSRDERQHDSGPTGTREKTDASSFIIHHKMEFTLGLSERLIS